MRRDHARAVATLRADFKRRNLSAKHTRNVVDVVLRFLATVPQKRLTKLARLDVEAYLATRAASGLSRATIAHDWWALHAFFKTLVKHELLDAAPTQGMEVLSPDPPPQLLLSEAAVRRLLAAASIPASRYGQGAYGRSLALRDRALLELFYATGVRDSEARAARVADLDQEGATLLVRSAKRGDWRRAPLTPRALARIVAYLRDARPALLHGHADPGHLFVTRLGTPLSQSTSFGIVRRAARLAGLRAHPHAFRRAIATHLVRAKVPIPAVQALLGHRRLTTTATYVTVDMDDLRRTVALLEAE